MDPISALIGAGASLLGGFMNSSSASAMNAANLANARSMASGSYLPALVRNAGKAGLSPLSVLGINTPSSPVQVGTDPGSGLMQAGRILSEMKLPGASAPSKLDQLQAQLLQAQIDNTNSETTGNMIRNSHLAVATQPGVRPGADPAHAIPAFAWFTDNQGRPFMGQSPEFAKTQFGTGSIVPGAIAGVKEAGEAAVSFGKSLWDDVSTVAPSVVRFFQNAAPVSNY